MTVRDPIVVVGSGATAVHFAQTALELGRAVHMLDVGYGKPDPERPTASLNELKEELDDPVRYFLGEDYEAVILPRNSEEYYGFPPSKSYVFRPVNGFDVKARGFAPLISFAQGGLAQAWTGGSYPFTDGELEGYPFGWEAIEPHYSEVARRIGVSGTSDDLAPYFPSHGGLQPPVQLNEHSARLLDDYTRDKEKIRRRHGMVLGHARIATLSQALDGRPPCSRLGRCLWGCPSQSLYTPSVTLDWCRRHPAFTYTRGVRITHFEYGDNGKVTRTVGELVASGKQVDIETGTLVLAAGTLASSRILLESLQRQGTRVELKGLMDNRQVLMPFVNVKQLGRTVNDRSYQYHQLAIGLPGEKPIDYVHGLVTTLTTALVHPIVQTLPIGVRAGAAVFRNLHSALGLVNINFPDYPRDSNRIALDTDSSGRSQLVVSYAPDAKEGERIRAANRRFRRFLTSLGAIAPPNMTRMRPMGASVHYAGTLPMTLSGGDFTTDRDGRCRPFENLVVADGSTLPVLPAKNLTFTLMANATRIARNTLAQ